MKKSELWKRTSTNGRWGITIVGHRTTSAKSMEWPAEGSLDFLGTFEGHNTYEFLPGNTAQWILPCGDVKRIEGCALIETMDLQSHSTASILVGGKFFVYKAYGYKRRSSSIKAFSHGKRIDISASVMAAMGLIPTPKRNPVVVEIPAIGAALQKALAKKEEYL